MNARKPVSADEPLNILETPALQHPRHDAIHMRDHVHAIEIDVPEIHFISRGTRTPPTVARRPIADATSHRAGLAPQSPPTLNPCRIARSQH